MVTRIDYSPAEDGYLVPSDAETIERSNQFAQQLHEVAGTLDAYFCPDRSQEHRRMTFGKWGDGSLNVLTTTEGDISTLKLGFTEPNGEGFLLYRTSQEHVWRVGKQTGSDAAVARTLDANWPLTLDNSAIRRLTDHTGVDASFEGIRDILLDTAATDGELESSEHAFTGSWLWNDDGRSATGSATITISRTDNETRYAFSIVLPHEHGVKDRANVTCTARLDGQYGVNYEVKSDDPDLTRLQLALPAIIDSLDYYLEAFVEAKITRETEDL
jgi:hypothetical protein